MKVSVVKETAPGERRVALVPEAVVKLRTAGLEVLVESGAGDSAWHTDDSYAEAGASVVSRAEALTADVVLMVGKPDADAVAAAAARAACHRDAGAADRSGPGRRLWLPPE